MNPKLIALLFLTALLALFIVPALRAGKTNIKLRTAASLFCGGLREQFTTANANPGLALTFSAAKTWLTDAAIARYLIVKPGSDANHIAVAGANDETLGVTDDSATAAEAGIAIAVWGKGPVKILTAGEAMATTGVPVYQGAGGKVMLSGTRKVGTLGTTAAADGDTVAVIEDKPAPVGYGTGAGGAVTQITSKATGVTLSKPCGAITLHNANLATLTVVSFVLTNTLIAAGDVLVLNHISGGTIGSYLLNAQCAAGSATINVTNITAGTLGEAAVIQFALVKGTSS